MPKNPDCPKCHGAGHYHYNRNHGTFCDLCCDHDRGWSLLKEHYGASNGKWCCLAGCGLTRDDNPDLDATHPPADVDG